MAKIVAIIQARMGSTRLPGKTMAEISGRPMIDIILSRIMKSSYLDEIVVATTTDITDDVLADHLSNNLQSSVFRGSENDLLDRYYHCAVKYNAEIIVRITADDPLKDPDIIDKAIKIFIKNQPLDYCSNCLEESYPEGLDVEVISFSALERAYHNATLPSEREHLTPYITNNPSKFKLLNFKSEADLSSWRWTVDKPEDLKFMRIIFENFSDNIYFGYREVVEFCLKNPDVVAVNQGTIRFEGYWKTVNEKG